MKTKTSIKAGRSINDGRTNHNETFARTRPLKVKSTLKAGQLSANHSETFAR